MRAFAENKKYKSPISGDVAVLVNSKGMPLQFANRYAYSMIEKSGGSLSSVQQALFVISRIYLWAKLDELDLSYTLFYGDFLTPDQVSDLTEFIQLTSMTQHKVLEIKQKGIEKLGIKRSDIINFKGATNIRYQYTSNLVYANRLRALRAFFKWVLIERKAQRIKTSVVYCS